VDGAVRAIAITITTARVRMRRAVRQGTGKGRVQRMGRVKGGGRQRRSGRGRGRETVKGKGLLNKLQKVMISLVLLLCRCGRKCMRPTPTRRAN
jgi:hypothetical protein